MEYYSWDSAALGRFAKHWATGEPMSPNLVAALQKSRHMFSAMNLQTQVGGGACCT